MAKPTVKQHLAAIGMLVGWLVTGQVPGPHGARFLTFLNAIDQKLDGGAYLRDEDLLKSAQLPVTVFRGQSQSVFASRYTRTCGS